MFYHGTTSKFEINGMILPASVTGIKRESWRTKHIDEVFFTISKCSAYMYAKKACEKYGGEPVVYAVKPIGRYYNTVNNEFAAPKAIIVEKII